VRSVVVVVEVVELEVVVLLVVVVDVEVVELVVDVGVVSSQDRIKNGRKTRHMYGSFDRS